MSSWILISSNAFVVNLRHNKVNFQWVVLDKAGYLFLFRCLYHFWSRSFKGILGCRIQNFGVHTEVPMNIMTLQFLLLLVFQRLVYEKSKKTVLMSSFIWPNCSCQVKSSLTCDPFFVIKVSCFYKTIDLLKRENKWCKFNIGTQKTQYSTKD